MLSYRVEGTGRPLLLIHGWGVTFKIWQNLAPLLDPHFQLIMIELPGIGNSPPPFSDRPYYPACADAIEEVRQALGIERWDILSYSAGTRAAEAYAQRYPQYVNCAVFLCPVYLDFWRSLGLSLVIQIDKLWPALGDWVLSDWRLYYLILFFGFNCHYHQYASDWMGEISVQSLKILKTTLREFPGAGHVPFHLPPMPTLFIWGRSDIIPSRPRRPGPTDRIVPGNHSAPMLSASAIAEVVMPFLAQ